MRQSTVCFFVAYGESLTIWTHVDTINQGVVCERVHQMQLKSPLDFGVIYDRPLGRRMFLLGRKNVFTGTRMSRRGSRLGRTEVIRNPIFIRNRKRFVGIRWCCNKGVGWTYRRSIISSGTRTLTASLKHTSPGWRRHSRTLTG